MIILFVFHLVNLITVHNLLIAKHIINRNIFKEGFSKPYIFINNLEIKLFATQQLKIILTIYLCTNGIRQAEIFKITMIIWRLKLL